VVSVYKRKESPFYQAKITVGGRTRRISTQERVKSRALAYAQRVEAEENQRLEREAIEANSISFVAAAALYFEESSVRPRTLEGYRNSFKNIYGTLGDFPMISLTDDMLTDYINQRLRDYRKLNAERKALVEAKNAEIDRLVAEGRSVSHLRRPVFRPRDGKTQIGADLRFMSMLWGFAMTKDTQLKTIPNPVSLLRNRGKYKPRSRDSFLTEAQVQALYDACRTDQQRLFILVCIDTGMRKGEVLGLRWDEIDFRLGKITLGNQDAKRTKSGKARIIPLTKRLKDALLVTLRAQKGSSQFVFPGRKRDARGRPVDAPMTTVKTFWNRLRKDAGLPNVTVHELRHTYASWQIQHGTPISVVRELLGHSHITTTERYAKESEDSIRRAMQRYEEVTLGHTLVHTTL